jgi:hypothetical protein
MSDPIVNMPDEETAASYRKTAPSLPDSFDHTQSYYQWLCRRKPYPMGQDNWWVIGIWISAALGIASILLDKHNGTGILGAISMAGVILSFFSSVGVPVVTLGTFYVWMPQAFKSDLKNGVIQNLFQASVSSKEILAGLRAWACRINLRYVLPVGVVLIAAILFPLTKDNFASLNNYSIALSIMYIVVAFMVWLFLLETGLVISVSIPGVGHGSKYLWAFVVLVVAFTGGNYIADKTQYYVVPPDQSPYSNNYLEQMWFCLIYSLLIGLVTLLPHFQAPRLLDDWKKVLLRESGRPD